MKFSTPHLTSALIFAAFSGIPAAEDKLGHQDTPLIPGSKWHVHDGTRPQPKIITPGEFSTQEKVGSAPSDATVLFDGKDLAKWKSGGADAKWKVENGYFEVVAGTGTLATRDEFGPDVQLHIEFATPPPKGASRRLHGPISECRRDRVPDVPHRDATARWSRSRARVRRAATCAASRALAPVPAARGSTVWELGWGVRSCQKLILVLSSTFSVQRRRQAPVFLANEGL